MREAMKNSSGSTALPASQNLSIQRPGERGSALVVALMCLLALFAITFAATKIRVASARDIEDKNAQAMQYWDARAGAATVEASLIADIPSIFDAEMLRAQTAVGLYPLPAFDAPSISSQFSRPVLNPDGSIVTGDAGQCTSLLGNLNAWAQRKSAVAENYASERGYGSDKAKIAVFREKLRQQLVGAAANAEPAYLLEYQIDSAVGDQGNVRGRVRPSGTILLGPAQPGCNTGVSLSANPTTIALGASSTLTVTYSNATHVWLTDQTGAIVQGTDTAGLTETSNSQTLTFTLSPIDNTTYRAHAEGSGCRAVSGEVGLIVTYPPPEITQFDATPACINRGQSATLNFNVRYASTITITGGGVNQTFPGNRGTVPTLGNLVVSPTTDTTYTITATGPGGTATRNVTVTVKQPFSIDQFVSNSYCVIPGNPVNLTWANTNAESATITDSTTGATVAVNPSGGTRTFTVNTPTTFTLTANRNGCSGVETITRQLTVDTSPVPTATFEANPTNMELGNSTTLQWTTTNATTVTITPSPVAGSGMAGPQTLSASGWLTITPTAVNQNGYTYTLTVTNNSCSTQTITRTSVVSVRPVPPPCPNVLSFEADSCVASGGNSNLRWNVANSDFVTITGPGINQTFSSNPNGAGSLIVNPTADSTYTLTATRSGSCTPGSPPFPTTATTNVRITRTPTVSNFAASPSIIDTGQTARLSWNESSNVSDVRITSSGGDTNTYNVPPGQRFVDVRPSGTANYTITVTSNDCSIQTATQSLTVTVRSCPTVNFFTASPADITNGQTSTLQWGTSNATQVLLNGSPVATNGSLVVNPNTTTTYRLTAVSANGSCNIDRFVTVNVAQCPAPQINSFTASPSTVLIGGIQTVRLSWSVTDTTGTGIAVTIAGVGTWNTPNGFVDISQPQSTTTYTLFAQNGCDGFSSTQVTVTATSCPPPTINSFFANPNTVTVGGSQTVRLSWNITDTSGTGVTVRINGVGTFFTTTGFVDIAQPQSTTTYSLTATNGCAAVSSAQATVTATSCSPPSINSFSANPSSIITGGSSTLQWTTSNAAQVLLDGNPVPNNGSSIVSPNTTTTYRLTAVSSSGACNVEQFVTVNVAACPPPQIASFSANPTSVLIGGIQTVRLSWSINDPSGTGVTVTIAGVGTWSTPNGFVDISQPQSTTTYTLTVTNGCGTSSTGQVTVTASSCPPPTINSFTASPNSVTQGGNQTIRLSWNITDTSGTGVTVRISGVGTFFTTTGFVDVAQPQSTTTYSLTATNGCAAGSMAQTTVNVTACPPPTINSFSVNPNSVIIGGNQSIRFFWNVTDPTGTGVSVTISGVGTYFTTTGAVDAPQPQSTTTYTLTVTNGCGGSATAQTTVTAIDPGCQTAVSLSANPTTIVLGGSTTLIVTYTMATHVWITDQNGTIVPGTDTNGLTEINSPRTLSFTVSPTNTTTYQANAEGSRCRVVSAPTTVTVNQPPVIIQASGTPACITRGQSTTLNFQVRFASTIRITGGGIDQTFPGDPNGITNGSLVVAPTTDTTYTITATGPGGTVSTTVTITVRLPFSIDQFSSDSYCVIPGSSVNLSWANTNAETATITNSTTGATVAVSPSGGTRSFTVNNPTTFTLTATHTGCSGVETLTRQLTVNTTAVPTATFQASPTDIELGNTTTLQWTSTNASTVTITPSPVAGSGMSGPQTVSPSGSLTITPTAVNLAGYTYTLTVTNNGCSSQTITLTAVVRVRPVPVAPACPNVISFTADSCVASGGNSTLRWTVSDADTVTITGPGINQSFPTTSGSMVVSPTADSTYTLTAARSGSCTPASPPAPTTASVLVRITRTPTVSNFAASPSTIDAGQTTRLSWNESANVASVRITSSGGDTNTYTIPPGQGFLDVRPTATANYTITVTNNDCSIQTATQSTTVTVNGCPTVTSFTGSPLTIFNGGSSTLQWTTSNATQVLLNGSPVAINGSMVVSPTTTTTYRLTAISANGSCNAERTVTINVNACPTPQVASFTASPSTVIIGGSQMVRLSWSINDSSSTGVTVNISPGVGSFSTPSGFVDITQPQSTTTYTITVTSGCGATTTAQTTITADACAAPTINSFSATPSSVSRGGNQTVRLSWNITDTSGTGVTITIAGIGTFFTPNGFVDIPQPQSPTTYTLSARSGCGATSTAQTTVSVQLTPCPTPSPGRPEASAGSGGGGGFAIPGSIETNVRIIYFAFLYPDGVMRFNLRLEVSNRSDGTGLSGHGVIGVVSRPQYTGFVGNLRYNFYGGDYQGQSVGFLGINFYDTTDNLVASIPFDEIINQGNYNIYTLSGNQSTFFNEPGAVLPYNNFNFLNDKIGISGFSINAGNISSSGGGGTFNTAVNGGTAPFQCAN